MLLGSTCGEVQGYTASQPSGARPYLLLASQVHPPRVCPQISLPDQAPVLGDQHPLQPMGDPTAKDMNTYWGTMVIWTQQMKRKTSEAHAT